MWHGTKNSDPKLFYQGDEGFDIKYANKGMWGNGIYFAENASYCLGYSYEHENNVKGMFLASVNLGRVQYKSSNSNLTGPDNGYDSVKGNTEGSDVYIVYANK